MTTPFAVSNHVVKANPYLSIHKAFQHLGHPWEGETIAVIAGTALPRVSEAAIEELIQRDAVTLL